MNYEKTVFKKSVFLIISALMFFSLFSGCVIRLGGSVYAELPDTRLGDISFTADTQRSVYKEYTADGSDFTLSVTDADGYIWTLSIPGHALDRAETISMTPLLNISSVTFSGEIAGGVLLSPNGLSFNADARIAVSRPGEDVCGLLFLSGHDGSGLEFMAVETWDGGICAPISHFSSVTRMGQSAAAMSSTAQSARAQLDSLIDEAKRISRTSVAPPPTPPSVSLECLHNRIGNGGSGATALKNQMIEYADSVTMPEFELITKLISADRAYSMAIGSGAFFDGMEWAGILTERLIERIDMLIGAYQSQPDKYLAVLYASINVWRSAAKLNIDVPPLDTLLDWSIKTMEHCLDEIEYNHDFRYTSSVHFLARQASIFSPTYQTAFNLASKLEERFSKIFRFKITYELIYNDNDETVIRIEGDGDVGYFENYPYLSGWGTGENVSCSIVFSDDKYEILPKSFPIRMMMEIKACESEPFVVLLLDHLGAEVETHVITDSDGVRYPYTLPVAIIEGTARVMFETGACVFQGEGETELAYIFRPELQNGQQSIVSQTFTGEYEKATITLLFRVWHTPY